MKVNYIFWFVLLFVLVSCGVENENPDAQKYTLDELRLLPGFEWFDYEFSVYQPKEDVVVAIDSLWKLKLYRFIVFVNPSCNCTETQKDFPSLVKVLKSSNIPDSVVEYWVTFSPNSHHPYSSKFRISKLPSCFIEIDSSSNKYYSCVDTFYVMRAKYPQKLYKIEDIILLGLQ